MPQTTTVTSRVAGLAAESEDTQVISGVAVGVDDVTRGLSGDRKVWTAEELRVGASTLEGTPVNPLHSDQDVGEVVRAGFDPDRGVLYEAEVTDEALARQAADGHLEVSIEARHVDGGTVETDQGEAMLAADIQFTGLSLVQRGAAPSASASPGEAAALSPVAIREALDRACLVDVNGEEIDLTPPDRVINAVEAGFEAKEEYDELSDCGTGVGEAMGEAIINGDLTPEIILDGGDIADNGGPTTYLPSHESDVDADGPPTEWTKEEWLSGCAEVQQALWGFHAEWFEEKAAEIEAAMEGEQAAEVAGVSFEGTAEGDLDESAIPTDDYEAHYLYPGDTKSESSYPVVDADGMLRKGNVDAAWQLGARGGIDADEHDRRLLDLAAEFDNPPEWAGDHESMAKHYDETATMQDVPDAYIFSNPGEAVAKAEEMGVGEGDDLAGDEMIHSHDDGDETVFMPAPSHEALMEMLEEMGELMPDSEFSEGDLVRWSTSASPGTGRVADVATEPGEMVSAEGADVTREATEDEAAYKLDNWVGPEAGYDEGVVVKSGSEILGAWEDAPEDARMAAGYLEAAGDPDDAISPETGPAEVSPGGEPDQRTDAKLTDHPTTMGDNDDTDDPEKVEELRASLQEKEETIAELRDRVEQLEDERADVAEAYAEALAAGDTVLDAEDFAEKFTVAELRERVEASEAATLADTEPAVQSGGSTPDDETASLSEADRDEVAERREAIATLQSSTSDFAATQAEQHAERIAELTGEEPDEVLAEV